MKTYAHCGRPGHPARHEIGSREYAECRRGLAGSSPGGTRSVTAAPPPPPAPTAVALASLGFPATAEFSDLGGGSVRTTVTNPDDGGRDVDDLRGLTVFATDEADERGVHELGVLEPDERSDANLRLVYPVPGLDERYRDGASGATFLVPSGELPAAYRALTTAVVRARYEEAGADPNRELARLGLEEEVFEGPGFPSGAVLDHAADGSLRASYDLGLTGPSSVTVEVRPVVGAASDDVLVGAYSRESEADLYDVPELEGYRDLDSSAYRVPRALAGTATRTLARAVIEAGAPDETESWERPEDYYDALARLD